ncbi:MAG: hypothetical protein FJZ01_01600 [Candidatus Sericytochromatia bacterium]|nr:hypothetical protein [Candidatus Tanganyikabacteria bacterium]
MTPRENLHRLVDQVADDDVAALERITEALIMSARKITWAELCRILDGAPEDDEEETPEEAAAVAEAREAVARGEVISHADLMREMGL